MSEIGRLVGLWRYPVKSMMGEPLEHAELSWHGIAGDRRWAFVRPGLERSGFPWLTIRERAELAHHRVRFADPSRPDDSPVLVTTPAGDEIEVADPALAAALGDGVRVTKQDRGVFDVMPLSIITTQTIDALAARVGGPLDVRRFRPNLLVDARSADHGFPEDRWVGAELAIGTVRLRVDQRDKRCVLVNVDPSTLERAPVVLRTIAQERDARAGVYGSTVRPGRLRIGDAVVLGRRD
jgi:uncharacterized protein YcbX